MVNASAGHRVEGYRGRRQARSIAIVILVMLLPVTAGANPQGVFVVTSTNDNGIGSLRQATLSTDSFAAGGVVGGPRHA